jgi:membrane-associated protease RseP (regulator of RpoE activity)
LTAIFFFIVTALFFSVAFVPAGIGFDDYSYSVFPIEDVTFVNGINLDNPSPEQVVELIKEENLIKIKGAEYGVGFAGILPDAQGNYYISLYDDAPAIDVKLSKIITSIEGVDITSHEVLEQEMKKYSPGQEIEIKGINENGEKVVKKIVLGENPFDEGQPYLGIGFFDNSRGGVIGSVVQTLSYFKDPRVYYESSDLSLFIYNLLWWMILICASVALINMVPVGIFDGGRFFYLTILAITKKERVAKLAFSFMTYLFLLVLALLMVFWVKSFF